MAEKKRGETAWQEMKCSNLDTLFLDLASVSISLFVSSVSLSVSVFTCSRLCSVCLLVHIHVCAHAPGSWRLTLALPPSLSLSFVLKQSLLLDLELSNSAGLSSQRVQGSSCLHLPERGF